MLTWRCNWNGFTDLEKLFDLNGIGNIQITKDIPNTLVKWLTYVLILHPIGELHLHPHNTNHC